MQIPGEVTISASREKVWAGLNDTAVLKNCINSCEDITWMSDHDLCAHFKINVGFMQPRFTVDIQLDDAQAPDSYVLTGQGNGGAMGTADGKAEIELVEIEKDKTLLKYQIDVEPSGALANFGAKLMAGTAQKIIGKFFDRFTKELD